MTAHHCEICEIAGGHRPPLQKPLSPQEGIVPALMANSGRLAVAGDHDRVVVERHQFLLNGADDFLLRAAPEVGAPDALGEESVAGKKNVAIAGKVKSGATRSMAGRMNDTHFDPAAGDGVSIFEEVLDGAALGHRHPDPLRLHVELFE